MNQKVLKSIKKYLYDIESTLEIVKDDFEKHGINLDDFLIVIGMYLQNFEQLKNTKNEDLLEILNVKLYEIITQYKDLDIPSYVTQMKANINFIKKHKDTFFHCQDSNEIPTPDFSDTIAPLKTINIQNFFSIKNISLDNLENKKEIYIVGENGDGKSLFLQAIAVGLKGTQADGLEEFRKIENKYTIEIENSKDCQNNFFAYGASRNNYCKINEDTTGYLSLFSGEYDLKSPTQWLIDLYNAQNANEKQIISLDEAISLLQKLLNRDIMIDVSYNHVMFREKGSEVSFEQLSAGYRGVITIICDLIARLSQKQRVEHISDFQGIVLIDEVELHLHPKWQYAFMNKLRETFPLIQFIVTTHSSTVLLGAGKEAVYYQIYKKDGMVEISEQREMKNDFLNDIQSTVFGFDVNDERINNPTNDDKARQKQAKDALLSLINTIKEEQ